MFSSQEARKFLRRSALGLAAIAVVGCEGLGNGPVNSPDQTQTSQDVKGPSVSHLIHVQKMTKGTPKAYQPTGGAAVLTYYGGPVETGIKVYEVLYGKPSAANVYIPEIADAGATPSVASFYSQISTVAFRDWLSEYNTDGYSTDGTMTPGTDQAIGRGSFGGQIAFTPTAVNAPAQSNGLLCVTDAQIQAELQAKITAGVLPQPDLNSLFMVHFPAGVTVDSTPPALMGPNGPCDPTADGQNMSCFAFCAYHSATLLNGTVPFTYGVLPDLSPSSACAGGCGASADAFQNQTSVSSHEMAETITDPAIGFATTFGPPLAWYSQTGGEIGDLCNAMQSTILGTDGVSYTVQQLWSNTDNACVPVSVDEPVDFFIGAQTSSISISLTDAGTSATVSFDTATLLGRPDSGSITIAYAGGPQGLDGGSVTVAPGATATITVTADNDLVTGGTVPLAFIGTAENSTLTHYAFTNANLTPLMTFNGLANATIEATDVMTAYSYPPITAHEGATALTVTCTPVSGSSFPAGVNAISCSATDSSARTATNSFTLTVVNPTPVTVNVPADMMVQATSASGASPTFTVTASNQIEPNPPVVCVPASGSPFPFGTTQVACTATTPSGVTGSGTFNVTVVDTQAPVLTVPANITTPATSPLGAAVVFTVTATDPVDPAPTITCNPASGSVFPIAKTTVNCTAKDIAGFSSTGNFTVTVTDSAPPTLNLPANMNVVAPSKSGVNVDYTASATDADGADLPVTCTPPSGNVFPIGATTVNCTAKGQGGAMASGSFTVTVTQQSGGGCSATGTPGTSGLMMFALMLAPLAIRRRRTN